MSADFDAACFLARRRDVLRHARRETGATALLVTDPVDIRYLCGLVEGSRSLLFGRTWSVVLTNRMFAAVAPGQCPGSEVLVDGRPDDEVLATLLRRRRVRRLGYQADRLSLARHTALVKQVPVERLVAVEGVTDRRRAVKDETELALLGEAVRIAEEAFRELLGRGVGWFVGRSEKLIAAELAYLMRLRGADEQAFEGGLIVAAGPHSASCHHEPTDRPATLGEPLLIDWGARLRGYRSDLTRTLFLGPPPEPLGEVFAIVREAHDAAVAAVRPGVRAATLERVARRIIDRAGYGEAFCHSLGHGVGLAIHEAPMLHLRSTAILRPGHVITIEPGIYLPGVGGVRLESDVLVTATGGEVLGDLPLVLPVI